MEIYIPGIFIGIVLVMFFYHLFLYFSTKELNYIYYILYIVGGGFIFMANDGFQFPMGDTPFWRAIIKGTIYNTFFFFWIVIFTQLFLNTKKQTPKLHVFLHILNALSVLSLVLSYFNQMDFASMISSLVGIVGFITIVIVAIICLKKGYRPARFFLVAHSFLALGTILFILTHVAYVLPQNAFSFYYMKAGMTLEIIFSSFALGDRINLLKAEKAIYQQNEILHLQENEKLKDKVNRELEEMVAIRTEELETKNQEITDSIVYAKRIQQSRLPSEKYIDKTLKRLGK